MRFEFDDEQLEMRDLLRELLSDRLDDATLARRWGGPEGPGEREDDVWSSLAQAGVLGVTVPEELGGLGLDDVALVLLLEECGRAVLDEPVLETAALAVPLLRDHCAADLARPLLEELAAGEVRVTVRLPGSDLVAFAEHADVLLVAGPDDWRLVPRPDVELDPQDTADRARPVARVTVPAGAGTPLGADARATARTVQRAAAASAAVLNGVSARILERTVAHVRDREQFGRPIGSFQAVKHKLADMHLHVEAARPAAWFAAYLLTHGTAHGVDAPPEAAVERAAATAKVAAVRAAHRAARDGLQLHGGMGFTWEHPLHRWLKHAHALSAAYGGERELRRVIAAGLVA